MPPAAASWSAFRRRAISLSAQHYTDGGGDECDGSNCSSNHATSFSKTLRSWLTSPGTLAVLSTGKQSLLHRRDYIEKHTGDVIDLCICLASVIGSLSIIIPYCINKRSRKLRHSLILGLATSDMVSSLIITSTTSFLLAGGNLTSATKFCNFAGYVFATSIWTQHLWNLSIAMITYAILVFPLSPIVGKIERHIIWLWPLFWAVSFIANGIAWALVGFVNKEGYCALDPNKRGDFAAIFAFVPRALVVLIIIVLYTHLFFFLRRVNLFSAAVSQSSNGRRSSQQRQIGSRSNRSLGNSAVIATPPPALNGGKQDEDDDDEKRQWKQRSSMGGVNFVQKVFRRADSVNICGGGGQTTPTTPSSGEGTATPSKRNGSASSEGDHPYPLPRNIRDVSVLTENAGNYADPEQVSPTTIPIMSNNLSKGSQQSQQHSAAAKTPIHFGGEPISPKSSPIPLDIPSQPMPAAAAAPPILVQSPPSAALNIPHVNSASTTVPQSGDASLPHSSLVHAPPSAIEDADAEADDAKADEALFTPMSMRRDVRDFGMTSPPQEHLKHYSLSSAGRKMARRAREENAATSSSTADENTTKGLAAGTLGGANNETMPSVTYDDLLGANWTWGMPVGPGQTTNDHTSTSASASAANGVKRQSIAGGSGYGNGGAAGNGRSARKPSSPHHWWNIADRRRSSVGGEKGAGIQSTPSSMTDENGVETTGSTLNRQASVLLLLYPGAYVLLFSISIIRFFVDTGTSKPNRDPRRNTDALHSIARWTIFAQGAIDAIVFQVIERAFRRRLRRRRRIAAGEHVADSWAEKAFKWMRRSVVSLRRPSTMSEIEAAGPHQ